ncbi:hypothetical protein HZA75_07455 [Candidatus Roizmanbacteria bacterium]|nr:hypothetical protein [Candidatus Roizmanbacteria bacterium]
MLVETETTSNNRVLQHMQVDKVFDSFKNRLSFYLITTRLLHHPVTRKKIIEGNISEDDAFSWSIKVANSLKRFDVKTPYEVTFQNDMGIDMPVVGLKFFEAITKTRDYKKSSPKLFTAFKIVNSEKVELPCLNLKKMEAESVIEEDDFLLLFPCI